MINTGHPSMGLVKQEGATGYIKAGDGCYLVWPGDFIIKDEKGFVRPYRPNEFLELYEKVKG